MRTAQKWNLITIKQERSGATGKWVCDDPNASIEVVGKPTLQHISFIQTGIKTSQADEGEIWVNEIHVKDTRAKDGSAWKTDMNLRWDGTGTIGSLDVNVYRKSIDQDFETFAPGTYDRDYLEDLAELRFDGVNVNGIKVLPVSASLQSGAAALRERSCSCRCRTPLCRPPVRCSAGPPRLESSGHG